MNVLIASTPDIALPPRTYGGIERIVSGLAQELVTRGHDVRILAAEGSSLPNVNCLPWVDRKRGLMGDMICRSKRLKDFAVATNAHIVHSFTRAFFSLGLRRLGVPVVHSYGVLPHRSVRLVKSWLGSRLTFTGCSRWIAQRGHQLTGGKWAAIHNFVELDKYMPTAAVAPDVPLVFLSRIDEIKGAHVAIEVARRSGRRLILAGNRAPDGPNARYWQHRIAPALKPGAIDYIGPVDDEQKNRLLSSAAALLVPIQWDEPFGIVFIESLACGTPVISCPRGALPEIVRPGIEGFLGSTIDELCRAVVQIGQIDRGNCRRRVEECFSSNRIAQEYETLYLRILDCFSPKRIDGAAVRGA